MQPGLISIQVFNAGVKYYYANKYKYISLDKRNTMDKAEAIQAYCNWLTTTPEFKENWRKAIKYYLDTGQLPDNLQLKEIIDETISMRG